MPLPRILTAAAAAAALAGGFAAPAADAACANDGLHLGTHSGRAPLGCPVIVYVSGLTPSSPRLTALRNGMYIDVTGQTMLNVVMLPVQTLFQSCDGVVVNMTTTDERFERYALTPGGVQVGERIGINIEWFGGLEVVPAGPCPTDEPPMLVCSESPPCGGFPPFGDDISSGPCAAGGGPGSLAPAAGLVALLALRRRRRRRPRG
jgi:uncharacterized protein (TIGR03382 family)